MDTSAMGIQNHRKQHSASPGVPDSRHLSAVSITQPSEFARNGGAAENDPDSIKSPAAGTFPRPAIGMAFLNDLHDSSQDERSFRMFGPSISIDVARTDSNGSRTVPRTPKEAPPPSPFEKEVGGHRRLSLTLGQADRSSAEQDSFAEMPQTSSDVPFSTEPGWSRRRGSRSFDPRLLRLEVEATLHRTLEMECILTAKELQSYEAQCVTAEVSHARSLAALEEAESVLRERRLQLEAATRHREEAQTLVRYLNSRVSSLSSRVRDGKSRIVSLAQDLRREFSSSESLSEELSSPMFVNAARVLESIETESSASPAVRQGTPPATSARSAVNAGPGLHVPTQPGIASRRPSASGLAKLGITITRDRPSPLTTVTSAIDIRGSLDHDLPAPPLSAREPLAMARMSMPIGPPLSARDPSLGRADAGLLSPPGNVLEALPTVPMPRTPVDPPDQSREGQLIDADGHIHQIYIEGSQDDGDDGKLDETNSQRHGEDGMFRPTISIPYGAQQLFGRGPLTGYGLSINTANAAGIAPPSILSAPPASNFSASSSSSSFVPPLSHMSPPITPSELNLANNAAAAAAAANAALSSGSASPTSSTAACLNYQRAQCPLSQRECKSQHICVRCSGPHPVILCKKDRNVCVKWNMDECASGCHREHRCLRCAAREHTLRTCPIRPLGGAEFCFAWNSAGTCRIVDCRRLHECIRCGASHPSIICPENLDNYLTEYIKRRRAEGYRDEELLRMELQLAHSLPTTTTPSTSAAVAAAISSGFGGGGGSIGIGGTHHPMHIAAVASAAAAMRSAEKVGPSGGLVTYAGNGMSLNGYGGVGLMNGGGVMAPHSLRGNGVSFLTEAEKKLICRDFNNFKCEVEDGRCRFSHACLRCGSSEHRERNCPLFDVNMY
ncbi:hypothetical protein DFJ73DRAFT_319803 [Zopfochytrium polystomum]|nr:hypothetical protein DFJ73DRAFT_319803 [Zopfochytrium polystomum]